MGAWESEPCANDTAWDWVSRLAETNDLSYIESTLDKVIFRELFTRSKVLDAPRAEEAIAAAAVLAMLRGKSGDSFGLTADATAWVDAHRLTPGAELLEKARTALDAVVSRDSELADLWKEGGEAKSWKSAIKGLRDALDA